MIKNKILIVAEIDEILSRNKFNRIQCTRSDFIDDIDDEGTNDESDSTDSENEREATLAWINGGTKQSGDNKDPIDDVPKELRINTAGTQHQSRLEKLKTQAPRFPRPLKSQSISDSSHGPSDADTQEFKQPVSIPAKMGRRQLLNKVPMPSGHERETDGFLKYNRKDVSSSCQ